MYDEDRTSHRLFGGEQAHPPQMGSYWDVDSEKPVAYYDLQALEKPNDFLHFKHASQTE